MANLNGHPKCYARMLGDCSNKLSKEHYVSASILELLGDKHTISNASWLSAGQRSDPLTVGALGSNILCQHHNESLSRLDNSARKFFSALLGVLRDEDVSLCRHVTVDGDALELWVLKAFCGALASKNLVEKGRTIIREPPRKWLDILFSGAPWGEGMGLHVRQASMTHFNGYSIGPVYVEERLVGGGSGGTVVWVDREGNSEPLLGTQGAYFVPRLSPDGQRLAVTNISEGRDVWTYDLRRGVLSRLTFDPGADLDPLWTPDGQRIVFRSNRSGAFNLYWKPADGSGEAEQLTRSEHSQSPYSWTPDGKVLAFWERSPQTSSDIWLLRLDGERTPELFLRTPFSEYEPTFSPDGRWIAYTSNESGRNEIYVRPFPASDGKWQISTGGGIAARWAANGRELFYLNGDQMMVAPVTTGDSFQAGTPRSLFTHVNPGGIPPNYAVAHDAQRFVMLQPTEPEVEPQINVVLNWFEELKRLVPTP